MPGAAILAGVRDLGYKAEQEAGTGHGQTAHFQLRQATSQKKLLDPLADALAGRPAVTGGDARGPRLNVGP